MSLFENLRNSAARFIAPSNSHTVESSSVRRGTDTYSVFTGDISGEPVPSESTALSVGTVYACTQVIAGAISSLPMHIYRRETDGDKVRDYNHSLWWVLNEEMSPRWTAAAGWSFLVASKLLHGNAYAEIVRKRSGAIQHIVPLHPSRVRPIASPDGMRLVYEIHPDKTIERPNDEVSRIRVIDQDDMLHVAGLGFDGLCGMPPLRHWLRNSVNLSKTAQDFTRSFLENHSRPDIAFKTEHNLTDEQYDELMERFEAYRGAKNAGKPIVLEGGLDIQPITMPLKDVQLLETRKFQVEEICRVYGVPPFMVGHTEKTSSWGSGVAEMGQGFVRFTLRDHLNAFENELNRKLFRTYRFSSEFDTRELERANTKELFESLRIALGRAGEAPFMTMEEVREFLSLPRNADLPAALEAGAGSAEPEQQSNNGGNGDAE
jgi:HK97 family phage portal protein